MQTSILLCKVHFKENKTKDEKNEMFMECDTCKSNSVDQVDRYFKVRI